MFRKTFKIVKEILFFILELICTIGLLLYILWTLFWEILYGICDTLKFPLGRKVLAWFVSIIEETIFEILRSLSGFIDWAFSHEDSDTIVIKYQDGTEEIIIDSNKKNNKGVK